MTRGEVDKRFYGFTHWYNHKVKPQNRKKKEVLLKLYHSELVTTGTIKIPAELTRSGKIEQWW